MRKNKCTGCKCRFLADQLISLPTGSTNKFHSYTCAAEYGKAKSDKVREKAIKAKAKKEKAKHTKAKKELKDNDRSFQLKKTQDIFNKYVRLRDNGLPCISCARTDEEIDYSGVGGKWDCGHYKTRGAYPELRFDERNAHRQCKKCNGGSGKYSRAGRSVKEGYDIGLLERVGQEVFDWLNGPHEPKKYTLEDLKELQVLYKHKIKELEE